MEEIVLKKECILFNICVTESLCCTSESESLSVVPYSLQLHDYTVHGTLQARILEWVAFPFSRESSQPRDRTQVSCTTGRFIIS